MLEEAVRMLSPFLDEIVFVGGVTLGLLIEDEAAEQGAHLKRTESENVSISNVGGSPV